MRSSLLLRIRSSFNQRVVHMIVFVIAVRVIYSVSIVDVAISRCFLLLQMHTA